MNDEVLKVRFFNRTEKKRDALAASYRPFIQKAIFDSVKPVIDEVKRANSAAEALQAINRFMGSNMDRVLEVVVTDTATRFALETFNRFTGKKSIKRGGADIRTIVQERSSAYIRIEGGAKIQAIDEHTRRQISREISNGIDRGDSFADIADNLGTRFNGDIGKARAMRIARTESVGASNLGRIAGGEATGLPMVKEWVSVRDGRTRRIGNGDRFDHATMDGTAIESGAEFWVTSESLRFPGDQRGSAANVINCRCVVTMKRADTQESELTDPVEDQAIGAGEPATVKEAERTIVERGIASESKLSGLDISVARKVLSSSERLFRQYGVKYDAVKTVNQRAGDAGYSQAFVRYRYNRETNEVIDQTFNLNRGHFEKRTGSKALSDWEKHAAKGTRNGWSTVESLDDLFNHEYGHRLTNQKIQSMSKAQRSRLMNDIRDELKAVGSKYATKDLFEAMAEIFSKYQQDPTAVPRKLIDVFNRLSIVNINGK